MYFELFQSGATCSMNHRVKSLLNVDSSAVEVTQILFGPHSVCRFHPSELLPLKAHLKPVFIASIRNWIFDSLDPLSLWHEKSRTNALNARSVLYLCLLYLSEELYTLSTNLLNPSYNQSPESHFTMNHSWNRHEFGFRNICIPKMRASFVLICIALLPHYEIVSVFYCWNVSILWSFYITDKLLISCLWNKFKSCFRSFVSNPGVSLSNYCLLLSFHNLIILALWRTTIASLYLARTNLNLSLWSLSCRYILISCTHTHTFANAHTAYFLLTLLCCCQKENQIYAVSHITWRCLLIC